MSLVTGTAAPVCATTSELVSDSPCCPCGALCQADHLCQSASGDNAGAATSAQVDAATDKGWGSLPADVLAAVLTDQGVQPSSLAGARAACRHWHAAFDASLPSLAPAPSRDLDPPLPVKRWLSQLPTSFPALTHLDLSGLRPLRPRQAVPSTLAAGVLAACAGLRHLQILDLSRHEWLCGSSLTALHHLTRLHTLSLQGCALVHDAAMIELLRHLPALRSLDVSHCERLSCKTWARLPPGLTGLSAVGADGMARHPHDHPPASFNRGQGLLGLATLTQLRSLAVSGRCSCCGRYISQDEFAVEALSNMTRLSSLAILHCAPFEQAAAAATRILRRFRHLRTLSLAHWPGDLLSGPDLTELPAGCPGLTALDLTNGRFSLDGGEWSALSQLPQLADLRLAGCHVEHSDLEQRLELLARLTELRLGPLSALRCLSVCTRLRVLSLNCSLCELPQELAILAGLPALECLRLRGPAGALQLVPDFLSFTWLTSLALLRCLSDSGAPRGSDADSDTASSHSGCTSSSSPSEPSQHSVSVPAASTRLPGSGPGRSEEAGQEGTPDIQSMLAECLPALRTLTLRDCDVLSDDGLMQVSALRGLKQLEIYGCWEVSAVAVRRLRCAAPWLAVKLM